MKSVDAQDRGIESGCCVGGVWPPEGWLTNRQTAERLGVGLDTLVSTWKYRKTLQAAARTVGKPGGGRCNLYPVDLVERIVAEREATRRAVVPEGFVDGDQAAERLGIARGTWNMWLTDGTIRIEHASMPGADGNGRRKIYAIAEVERVRGQLRAAGQLFRGVEELGKGKWLNINEAAAAAGVWVKTWDLWSKSGRVPAGEWVKGPMGQPTQMWLEKVALNARTPETGDGTWVTKEETITILRTSKPSLSQWIDEGRVPAGEPGRSNGSFALLWRADVVRALRAEWDARPFPPEGWVDRAGAIERMGISPNTLTVWVREGRFPYEGKLVEGPNRVECRIYEIAKLDAALERMKAADAERVAIPEGWVDADGAGAILGIAPLTVFHWAKEKKIRRGKPLPSLIGGRQHIYKIADLEKSKARLLEEAQRPVAPEGFIALHDAVRLLGVKETALRKWEQAGVLPEGKWVQIPGSSARTKIYKRAVIERRREAMLEEIKNFPPAGWLTIGGAAQRAKVSLGVWKKWIVDGRADGGQWVTRPTGGRCKLFSTEEVDRLLLELGRDHEFYLEPDGSGGWKIPAGHVDRDGAAAMFGVATGTFVHWQCDGRITCGRWARVPSEHATIGVNGRRAYPVEALRPLVAEWEQRGKPYLDANDPSIARVPIMSWSKTRGEAIIEAADLPLIEGLRFNLMDARPEDGAEAVVVRSGPSGEQTPLRRIIIGLWGIEHRYSHRNGDVLDCRRANILVRTHGEQNHGCRKRRTTMGGQEPTSRFKGVCWTNGKWKAGIQKEKQSYKLGTFEDEIAAAQAYDEKAIELYGEFARINFPDGVDARLEREAVEASAKMGEGETEAPATARAA